MNSKKANIRSVAEAAGVSCSTVSLVLNNRKGPSRKTRQQVIEAADGLSYRPEPLFQQAFQRQRTSQRADHNKTQTIGFLTSEMISQQLQRGDDYYSRVLSGIQRSIESRDYHLMVRTVRLNELALPAMVTERRVDGLVIEGDFSEEMLRMLAKQLPISLIDRTCTDLEADSVMPNVKQAMREQLHYLWDLGHQNIVTFQHAAPDLLVERSLRAFHQFFAERNHVLAHPTLCERREINSETHHRVIAEYAQELAAASPRPTALMTGDPYACDLLREFSRLGIRVPHDLSITGMDDIAEARASRPQLTSYRFPMEEMGHSATDILIERIQDRDRPIRHLLINGQFMERASCATVKTLSRSTHANTPSSKRNRKTT
jgi:LacI family transcriptional regulator